MASLFLLLFYHQTICQNVELGQNLNFAKMLFEIFQSMNCVRKVVSQVYQLLCCPDGTTVLQGGRKISFVPEKDPRCPESAPQAEVSGGDVRNGPLQAMTFAWAFAIVFVAMAIVIIMKRLFSRN